MDLSELLEDSNKDLVIIYPGRFHPFHIGHGKVYQYLKINYPNAQVFISTSGKVDGDRSPFTFEEKKKMMVLAGVDSGSIVQCKSPYQSVEITERFDENKTVVVFAVSEKDMAEEPRFDFSDGIKLKKNGEPAYLQQWRGLDSAETFSKHGYLATTPTYGFKVRGQEIKSASQIRNMIAQSDDTKLTQMLQDLYNITDVPQDIIEIFKRKIGNKETMNENWDDDSFSEFLKENANKDNIMKNGILKSITEGVKVPELIVKPIITEGKNILYEVVLDVDYSRNPDALVKAINTMGKRLNLTLMNAPSGIEDLKTKGEARLQGGVKDITAFVEYLYKKGIMPYYNIIKEGKSPHKKGTKKYNAHMAAIHAESNESEFARKIQEITEKKISIFESLAADIKDYVDDHKEHFDAYPVDVEVGDKIYDWDEYWAILDKVYPDAYDNQYAQEGVMGTIGQGIDNLAVGAGKLVKKGAKKAAPHVKKAAKDLGNAGVDATKKGLKKLSKIGSKKTSYDVKTGKTNTTYGMANATEAYNEEATQKPYVSMYKDSDNKNKMVYDVLDKYGKSAFKSYDKDEAQKYFKDNYKSMREVNEDSSDSVFSIRKFKNAKDPSKDGLEITKTGGMGGTVIIKNQRELKDLLVALKGNVDNLKENYANEQHEQLEYIHHVLQECGDGNVDNAMVDQAIEYVEDIREQHFNTDGSTKSESIKEGLDNDDTRNIAIRCIDEMVAQGLIANDMDTDGDTEFQIQDIIHDQINKALQVRESQGYQDLGNIEGYLDTIDEYVEMLFRKEAGHAQPGSTSIKEIAYRIQNAVDDIRTRELELKPSLIRAKYNKEIKEEIDYDNLNSDDIHGTNIKDYPEYFDVKEVDDDLNVCDRCGDIQRWYDEMYWKGEEDMETNEILGDDNEAVCDRCFGELAREHKANESYEPKMAWEKPSGDVPKDHEYGPGSEDRPKGKRGYSSSRNSRTAHLKSIKKWANKKRRQMDKDAKDGVTDMGKMTSDERAKRSWAMIASKDHSDKETVNEDHNISIDLLRAVARQMEDDAHKGDYTAIEELLQNVSEEELKAFLSDHRSQDWSESVKWAEKELGRKITNEEKEELKEFWLPALAGAASRIPASTYAGAITGAGHLAGKAKNWIRKKLKLKNSRFEEDHKVDEWVQDQDAGNWSMWTAQERSFIQELCLRHDGVERDPAGLKYLGKSELWDEGSILKDKGKLTTLMLWVKKNKDDIEGRFTRMFKVYSKGNNNGQSDGNQVLQNIIGKIGKVDGVTEDTHGGDLKKMQDAYKYNEDRNNHSENILMLAQAFGDRGEIKAVEGLLKVIKRQGYVTPDQSEMMYKAIHKKYYSQLFPTENEGNEFSGELAKAKIDGKKEFKVDGKTYKVKEALTKLIDKQKFVEAGIVNYSDAKGKPKYKEGQKAAKNGEPYDSNPYDGAEKLHWSKGHNDWRQDSRRKEGKPNYGARGQFEGK